MAKTPRSSQVLEVLGGCLDCGTVGDARWHGPTAMMTAERHARATGHTTWANQTIEVFFNPGPAEQIAGQGTLGV